MDLFALPIKIDLVLWHSLCTSTLTDTHESTEQTDEHTEIDNKLFGVVALGNYAQSKSPV